MSKLLEIQHIEKYYGSKGNLTKALDDVSFEVEKQDFMAIMGASGSGKTTLLNCISTIDKVTAGSILMNSKDITRLKGNDLNKFRREKLGFIFQDFNLLDTLTAYENIALALTIQKVSAAEIDRSVREIADRLDITDVLNKYPYQMAGGQKQRTASARAVITNPELILADEPTGNLDSNSGADVMNLIRNLSNEGKTIVLITHDAEIAKKARRTITIKDGLLLDNSVQPA